MQITESGGIVFNDEKGNTQYITEEELKELWNNKCKDSVVESVRNKLLERSNVGVKKYGEQLANYRDWETDRKSTRLNSSHITRSRMPSSA